jgi:hypothetical protein
MARRKVNGVGSNGLSAVLSEKGVTLTDRDPIGWRDQRAFAGWLCIRI